MTRPIVVVVVSAVLLFGRGGAEAASVSSGSLPASVTADPLRLALTLSNSRTTVGSAIKAKGSATNLETIRFSDVVLTIRLPSGISVVGSASHDLGPVAAGATAGTSWALCARASGNYIVMISGTATDAAGRIWTATSGAVLQAVSVGTKKCK